MKTPLIIAALIFFATTIGKAEEAKLPLIVDVPPQWTVEFKGDKGIQFFTVTRTEAEPALLMFSRWPAPGNKDQIPNLVDSLGKRFLEHAKANPKIKLESEDYITGEIKGTVFSGKYASFTIFNGLLQTMFMISDGDGIWNGQFTGSKERWAEALEILRKLKNN